MSPVTTVPGPGRAGAASRSRGVIIADDLTGAADACVAFVTRGLSGAVLFDASMTGAASASSPAAAPPSSPPGVDMSGGDMSGVDVIAISTDTRGLSAGIAAERVRGAVLHSAILHGAILHGAILHCAVQNGVELTAPAHAPAASASPDSPAVRPAPPWLFKKIDSTLRGPVGAELLAAMTAARARVAIVAPAFPAMGRFVDGGVLHTVGRGALPAFDIVNRLRAEGIDGCARITRPPTAPADAHDAWRDAWRDALVAAQRGGAHVLVCDSLEQPDLDAIVDAAGALDGPILWTGAAGLAHALAGHVTSQHGPAASTPASTADRARGSPNGPGGPNSPYDPNGPGGAALLRATSESIVFVIGSNHPVTVAQQERLVHDATPMVRAAVADARAITRALALRLDLMVAVPPDAAEADVARFGETLTDRQRHAPGSCSLVMSGGDTAARVCRHLAATRIDLDGEVGPGIPWGTLSIRSGERWPVVLKAGGFGADDDLVRARQFLMRSHDRSF